MCSREDKNEIPHLRLLTFHKCHAGRIHAQPRSGCRAPKKYCPPPMRGNSHGGGQTTNNLLAAANV